VMLPVCAIFDMLRGSVRGLRWQRVMLGWSHLLVLLLAFAALRVRLVGSIVNRFRRLDNPIPFEQVVPPAAERQRGTAVAA
jgi:hypothetical protein